MIFSELRIRVRLWRYATLVFSFQFAYPANATNLLEAYNLALASDPVFDAARFALEAARERLPQARAGLLPIVNATGNKGVTHAETAFTDVEPVDRNMKSWTWNLQLTQPIIRLSNLFAYREAEFIVAQAAAQYANAQQDLLVRVSQSYFAVVVAQEAVTAAGAEVRALTEQLAQVSRGYKAGTHSVTDVDETKARVALARSQEVSALSDLESRRADLEKVTGQNLMSLNVLHATVVPPRPMPRSVQAWVAQARESHPLVRAQRAALSAAEEVVRKNTAEHLPTLDLVASRGTNYTSNSLTTPADYSTRGKSSQIGLQLTIPIFAGGSTSSKVAEAIANRNKARADLEAASRQASTEAQQAYAGVTNGLAQIDALNSAIEFGQSAVKGNQVGYRLGLKINSDVLNAEQQLHGSTRDLAKARYETLLQGLKLKASAGILSESDIVAVNGMLAR